MSEPWRRTIGCLDVGGRERELVIGVEAGKLLLNTPPGEQAVIPLSGADVLKDYIAEGQRVAAELLVGFPPLHPVGGGLRSAQTFYVFDAQGQIQKLAIGVAQNRVVVNGPGKQWQAADDTAIAAGTKLLALGRDLWEQRRR